MPLYPYQRCFERRIGFGRIGTVFGIWQAIGAALNLTTPAITKFILEDRGGDWSVLLWVYLGLCIPQVWLVRHMTQMTWTN